MKIPDILFYLLLLLLIGFVFFVMAMFEKEGVDDTYGHTVITHVGRV